MAGLSGTAGPPCPRRPLLPRRQKADEAQPLEGGRYHTHGNGTLQISETSQDDAGAYSCWVENAKGKTAVTASLDVRSNSPPPLLLAGPGPLTTRGGPSGPQRVPCGCGTASPRGWPGALSRGRRAVRGLWGAGWSGGPFGCFRDRILLQ